MRSEWRRLALARAPVGSLGSFLRVPALVNTNNKDNPPHSVSSTPALTAASSDPIVLTDGLPAPRARVVLGFAHLARVDLTAVQAQSDAVHTLAGLAVAEVEARVGFEGADWLAAERARARPDRVAGQGCETSVLANLGHGQGGVEVSGGCFVDSKG